MLEKGTVQVVDADLLQELCLKHGVPFSLAQRIISEFATIEGSKKRYIRQIVEEGWNEHVDKKVSS